MAENLNLVSVFSYLSFSVSVFLSKREVKRIIQKTKNYRSRGFTWTVLNLTFSCGTECARLSSSIKVFHSTTTCSFECNLILQTSPTILYFSPLLLHSLYWSPGEKYSTEGELPFQYYTLPRLSICALFITKHPHSLSFVIKEGSSRPLFSLQFLSVLLDQRRDPPCVDRSSSRRSTGPMCVPVCAPTTTPCPPVFFFCLPFLTWGEFLNKKTTG